MSSLYFSEVIVGTSNTTVFGTGLTSTEAEPKKLKNLILTVSARAGNRVEGWYEREKRLDIIDRNLPLPTETHRVIIPIDFDIAIGKTWKVAINSGGTATDIYVTYEYELT